MSQKLTRWAEMAILRSLGVIGLLIFLGAMIPGLSGMAVGAELAETDMEQGKIFFQQGKFGQAAFKWNEAAKNFEQGGDLQGQSQALLFLAESLQQLGQYHKAALTLELARSLAVQTGDVRQQARVLGRLGNIYFSVASGLPQEGLKDDTLKKAEASLQEALVLARELEDSGLSAGLLNDLGNVLAAQNRNADALGHYIEATILAKATGNTALEATALINASKASLQEGELSETHERLKLALETVQKVPDSHDKAYGLLTIGLTMNHLQSQLSASSDEGLVRQAAETFEQAASVAETIGDARAESYAWGYLGHLYEEKGRFEESLSLTRKAILAAQQGHAPESLYRWHWQMARLLKKKGHMAEAVLAYKRATYTLDPIRQEVMLTQPSGPNSFRESIGPLFFELADLLLKEAKTTKDPTQLQNFLKEARGTVENFKTAELQDYFRDDCVEAARSQVTELDEVSQSTVIIYPIVLEERMELLVSLPSGLKRYEVPVTKTVLTEEVRAFRQKLEKRTTRQYLPHAQALYQWLILPVEEDLEHFQINTLVFVPDGPLRTIPMAALHDGQRFLITKYALATTPGLTVTDPKPIDRANINLFSVGLTEAVRGFPPLPYVATELESIQKLYGGKRLLDKQFLVNRMEQEMKKEEFTIVHIASHGIFSNDPKKSFLLTYEDKLTMDRLDELIGLFQFRDNPLDLLTLSACETAAGDDRAALGLAGVAIKAGARSALATLWFINDQVSSELVTEFYRQLQDPTHSKAVALQHAQIQVLENPRYAHPGYWAPFLLINNWL